MDIEEEEEEEAEAEEDDMALDFLLEVDLLFLLLAISVEEDFRPADEIAAVDLLLQLLVVDFLFVLLAMFVEEDFRPAVGAAVDLLILDDFLFLEVGILSRNELRQRDRMPMHCN